MKKLKANNSVRFSKNRLKMLVFISIAFVVAVFLSIGDNANVTTRFGWNPVLVKAYASVLALVFSSLALSIVGVAFLPVFPPLAFALIIGSGLFILPAMSAIKELKAGSNE